MGPLHARAFCVPIRPHCRYGETCSLKWTVANAHRPELATLLVQERSVCVRHPANVRPLAGHWPRPETSADDETTAGGNRSIEPSRRDLQLVSAEQKRIARDA